MRQARVFAPSDPRTGQRWSAREALEVPPAILQINKQKIMFRYGGGTVGAVEGKTGGGDRGGKPFVGVRLKR